MKLRFLGNGVEVSGGLLWIDAPKPEKLSVITHAHGDHVARHETILCTPATAALVRRRTTGDRTYLERNYGEQTAVGDLTVTLLPAGHILGSALAYVEGPEGSLLVTGDVRLEGGLTCPPAEPRVADILVTESTFGRPDHRLPPADQVRVEMVAFARDTLEAGETPVLLAYSLGKGQEVMTALANADIPVAAHGTVWNICRTYRRLGIKFPGSRKLNGNRQAAIVCPPRYLKTREVQAQAPLRVAAITGWGDRTLGKGVDRSFLLSDHSDFDGLLGLAERVQPKKVFTYHGYAEEFAQELRSRGYDAEAVTGHSGPTETERPGMFGQL